MTHDPMKALKEFHDRYHPERAQRKTGDFNHALLRKRRSLIKEEAQEVVEALEYLQHVVVYSDDYDDPEFTIDGAVSDLAGELADLLYVVYGTAEELGLDIYSVFAEIHRSNMDKLWPDGEVHYNSEGKVIKPPTYTPPDLSFVNEHRV